MYPDGRADGEVTADEAHAYVQRTLRDLGVRNQQPSFTGTDRLLVSGRLEAAPDLHPSARELVNRPAPIEYGPRTTDMRVVVGAGALAGVGLITALGRFFAVNSNPDATPETVQAMKTVNAIGLVSIGVGGVAAIVPTRPGAALNIGGTF